MGWLQFAVIEAKRAFFRIFRGVSHIEVWRVHHQPVKNLRRVENLTNPQQRLSVGARMGVGRGKCSLAQLKCSF
ncbi:MAG: hypothetical protein DMG58_11185 [Acidobacteria bacterium]|nr:MAG: hypothetical protein DMG58_11185 [Acidobacteriota bacterium]